MQRDLITYRSCKNDNAANCLPKYSISNNYEAFQEIIQYAQIIMRSIAHTCIHNAHS